MQPSCLKDISIRRAGENVTALRFSFAAAAVAVAAAVAAAGQLPVLPRPPVWARFRGMRRRRLQMLRA